MYWEFDWTDYQPDATPSPTGKGEIHFAWVLEGRVVQDVWIFRWRKDGRLGWLVDEWGTTIRFYDPGSDVWRISQHGTVNHVIRVLTARSVGNEIWVEGLNLNGQSLRWMFSQITSHSFHGGNFLSGDGGQTWRIQEELEARRMAWKTRTKSGKAQMARTQARPRASRQVTLQPYQIICRGCGNQMRMGHHSHRMVIKLQGCTHS